MTGGEHRGRRVGDDVHAGQMGLVRGRKVNGRLQARRTGPSVVDVDQQIFVSHGLPPSSVLGAQDLKGPIAGPLAELRDWALQR